MTNRNILISGAGIAGPTLAYWLLRWGFTPTLIEQAPLPRTGGYMIDFWGLGWNVAERMHLIPRLLSTGYQMEELRLVNGDGRRVAALDAQVFRTAAGEQFTSLLRGDLASAIYSLIGSDVETIFADSIHSLRQDETGVDVVFQRSAPRRFDLVIGCDGLHSTVRSAVFGGENRFEHYLGYKAASFSVAGYPHRDDGIYVSYCTPGRQIARYSLRDGRTAFFFVFLDRSDRYPVRRATNECKAILRRVFGDAGWECPAILDAMNSSGDLYFDAVSQTRMEHWYNGRVALLGDACFCPSLLAGQGSSFAMAGAYLLAGELKAAAGNPLVAFPRYQSLFKPFIDGKQKGTKWVGGWFAPKTQVGVNIRTMVTRLMNYPFVSAWMMKSLFADRFELPQYEA